MSRETGIVLQEATKPKACGGKRAQDEALGNNGDQEHHPQMAVQCALPEVEKVTRVLGEQLGLSQ